MGNQPQRIAKEYESWYPPLAKPFLRPHSVSGRLLVVSSDSYLQGMGEFQEE